MRNIPPAAYFELGLKSLWLHLLLKPPPLFFDHENISQMSRGSAKPCHLQPRLPTTSLPLGPSLYSSLCESSSFPLFCSFPIHLSIFTPFSLRSPLALSPLPFYLSLSLGLCLCFSVPICLSLFLFLFYCDAIFLAFEELPELLSH